MDSDPLTTNAGLHVIIYAGLLDWAEDVFIYLGYFVNPVVLFVFCGGECVWRETRWLFCMQVCVCAEPSSLAVLSCCHGVAWPHCETNRQVDLSVMPPLLAHRGCTKHPFTLSPMWETTSCGKKRKERCPPHIGEF